MKIAINKYITSAVATLLVVFGLFSAQNAEASHVTFSYATGQATGYYTATLSAGAAINSFPPPPPNVVINAYFALSATQNTSCASLLPQAFTTIEVALTLPPSGGGFGEQTVGDFTFFTNVGSLQGGTTYWGCAYITENDVITAYSNVFTFKTDAPPTLFPPGPTSSGNIVHAGGSCSADSFSTDGESARLIGAVNATGAGYGYFRLSPLPRPPIFCNEIYGSAMRGIQARQPNADGSVSGGTFEALAQNLTPDTLYYFCPIVSNSAFDPTLIEYGPVCSFRTPPCETCPQTSVKTLTAFVLGARTASLQGELNSTRAATAYFQYRPANVLGAWTEVGSRNWPPGTYRRMDHMLTNLEPDTTYAFRAVAETDAGTFYGDILTFKTHTRDGFSDFGGWIYGGIDFEFPTFEIDIPPGPGVNFCPPGTIPNPNYNPGSGAAPLNPGTNEGSGGNLPALPDPNLVQCIPLGPGDFDPNFPITPGGGQCPTGWTGTYPSCVPPPGECPEGWTGEWPMCVPPPGTGSCPDGWVGEWPTCSPGPMEWPPNDFGWTGNVDDWGIEDWEGTPWEGFGFNPDDWDGDGLQNWLDNDNDNDGIPDIFDPTPFGPGSFWSDLDNDGIPNSIDNDIDNDGIPNDQDDMPYGGCFNPFDLDCDGIPNWLDPDVDGDGIPNHLDDDIDNDGIVNSADTSPFGLLPADLGMDKDSGKGDAGLVLSAIDSQMTNAAASEAASMDTAAEAQTGKRGFFGRIIDAIKKLITGR